jgi:hypothetical protein
MEYSLENAKQLAKALENRNKGFKVVIEELITEQLTGTPTATDTVVVPGVIDSNVYFTSGDVNSGARVYYFGILTVGNNVDHAKLYISGTEFIEIQKNSQIVDFFTDVKYFDSSNVELAVTPQGHFRGYRLSLNVVQ